MKKFTLPALFIFLSILIANAQYSPVNFDFEKTWFNQGGLLPAETYFTLNGQVPSNIQLVELSIYRNAGNDPLFTTQWTRAFGNQSQSFAMPVNYKLRGDTKYSFVIQYFIPATEFEKKNILDVLSERFSAYVDQMVEINNNNIRLLNSYKIINSDLNSIMELSMRNYRSRTGFEFTAFSTLVETNIRQLEDLQLKKAFLYVGKRNNEEKIDAKSELVKQQLDALKQLIISEAEQYLSSNLLSLYDKKVVVDYLTEKTINTLRVNAGYAGVYENGGVKNLSYGTAPFVGVSFPLGSKAFASSFWSNTSASAGVMLTKIETTNENIYTGPIINLPIYTALGYKVFNIFRINAGVTLLQKNVSNGLDVNLNSLLLRPFVGASFEINVWAGLSK
jgi:hypothetical protein